MSRRLIMVAGALVLMIAGGGAWYVLGNSDGAVASVTSRGGYEISPNDRTMGNPKAKVVLIEYAAISCPVCAAFNAQVMPQVKKNYVDTGKVLYVFRMYPRMPEDGAGEKMARCLPKTKYFSLIDLFFQNQAKWDPEFGVLDAHGGMIQLGRIVGISAEQADRCIADTHDDARINAVAREAETRYGLTGTPTLVINGVAQPSGGLRYTELSKLLDQAARP